MNFLQSLLIKFRHWQYERKCLKYFGAKPEKIYLSEKDYDALVERLNKEPDPKAIERFKQIMERKSPWKE